MICRECNSLQRQKNPQLFNKIIRNPKKLLQSLKIQMKKQTQNIIVISIIVIQSQR